MQETALVPPVLFDLAGVTALSLTHGGEIIRRALDGPGAICNMDRESGPHRKLLQYLGQLAGRLVETADGWTLGPLR